MTPLQLYEELVGEWIEREVNRAQDIGCYYPGLYDDVIYIILHFAPYSKRRSSPSLRLKESSDFRYGGPTHCLRVYRSPNTSTGPSYTIS